MKTCENCKHWGATPDKEWEAEALSGLRECEMARVPHEYDEEDTRPTEPKSKRKPPSLLRHPRSLMAAAGAARGEASRLYTATEFSCVHWDGAA